MPPEVLAMVPPNDAALSALLEQSVGARNFDHWFRDKVTLTVDGDNLSVGVGSPFILSWIQRRFRQAIAAAAQAALGASATVSFHVDPRASLAVQRPVEDSQPAASSALAVDLQPRSIEALPAPALALVPPLAVEETRPARCEPARSGRRFADLSDFVEGECNQLAAVAAKQVCESPGSRYNPLFLYGGVGVGKTHLLEGIYRRMRRMYPSLQVTFLTAEAFANYFTQALREHTLPGFRSRFRTVDVLLIDEVDFLDNKRVIQEEFLHTFKQLESHGRQIVVTSDRHPRLLPKVSDELSTRFLSGLVCRIESPDAETRLKIVERKAAKLHAEFAPEALEYVAQRFRNNVRELEGALNCLDTQYAITRKRITPGVARKVLADLERDCIRMVQMSDVETVVCNLFGVRGQDLKSASKQRTLAQPRMLAMFLSRKHTHAAYSEIGQYFGGRNHSTVMSAEKTVQRWIEERAPVRVSTHVWAMDDLVDALEQQLQAC